MHVPWEDKALTAVLEAPIGTLQVHTVHLSSKPSPSAGGPAVREGATAARAILQQARTSALAARARSHWLDRPSGWRRASAGPMPRRPPTRRPKTWASTSNVGAVPSIPIEMSREPRYLRPGWFVSWVVNPLLMRFGVVPSLAVRGRRNGEWRRVPVNVLELDGQRYLVAPRGDTQWARNLRATGRGELRWRGRVESFRTTEVSDHEKPRINYASRPGVASDFA